jgi:hypothetical protein
MLPLRRVALHRFSHPAPRRVALFRLHGASRVSWPSGPSIWAGVLQGPSGHSSSPHRPDHDGLVYHGSGDDLDDTLERASQQALTEFCERHLPILGDTAIALLPIRNEGNAVWSERVAAIGDPELLTHHAGWALTARYAQYVSSLLQEVTARGAHLRLRLEDCARQVKAKNCVIKDIQEGNRDLLQKNAHLETCIGEPNDELIRTYRSCDFKTDDLDDSRTRLQQAQDELTAAQSYIHHLGTELHVKDEQLEASHAQAVGL